MAIIESDKLHHWNYFLAVEEDLHHLSRFIEFSKANFKTYSIEIVRILFAASAEIDVVAKQFCEKIQPSSKASNINEYRQIIKDHKPVLIKTHVEIPRHGLTLSPWVNWEADRNPDWWTAYNNVKHSRNERFSDGNLQNTLNAVAGLFVLLLFLHREQAEAGELTPNPSLLRLGAPFDQDALFWNHTGALVYRLNEVRKD